MSFKCQVCGKAQEPRIKPNRIIVETKNEGRQIAREENRCDLCVEDKDESNIESLSTSIFQ